jgi:type IV secretory pathway TrbL component
MSSIKNSIAQAGATVADKAGDAAQAVATGVNQATEYVKEKAGVASPASEWT